MSCALIGRASVKALGTRFIAATSTHLHIITGVGFPGIHAADAQSLWMFPCIGREFRCECFRTCRLDLAERIRIPQTSGSARRPYGFEAAIRTAEAQEAAHPDQPLPFACTVMVIGMTGVGKSATINSVLSEDEAAPTNAFEPATKGIKVVTGTVAGVRVKFIDTPGLQPSAVNIGSNQRLLNQMHGAFKKHKPDIMLYMDRADIFRCPFVAWQ